MIEEISLIIAENIEFTSEIIDGDEISRCHPNIKTMRAALYKLFLTKQIELLNEIRPFIGIGGGLYKINEVMSDIDKQLKELEP